MVKRKGLDFTEYGLVDARAAKRQRLSGDSNDPKYVLNSHAVEDSVLCSSLQSWYSLQLVCRLDSSVSGRVLTFTIGVAFKLGVSCVRIYLLSYITKDNPPLHLAAAITSKPLLFFLIQLAGHVTLAVNPP